MTKMAQDHKIVYTAEQIQQRIAELGRQINQDFRGKNMAAVGVLEDGFVFMADLVRHLDVALTCQFLKPERRDQWRGNHDQVEIFFSPEINVKDAHVLLVQGVIDTAITTDFLIRNMIGRGAQSVKVAAFLDRSNARRISLDADYFGFQVDDSYVYGYGMGSPQLNRNLPYVAARNAAGAKQGS